MNRSAICNHALLITGMVLVILLMGVSCNGGQSPPTVTPSPRLPPMQATSTRTLVPTLSPTPSIAASPYHTTPAWTTTPSAIPTAMPTAMPTTPRPDAEVAAEKLNMRSGPGLQYTVLRSYPRGTALEILGQGPDNEGLPWLFVLAPDGSRGWVSARPSLATTQYVIINLATSAIASWPTPTAPPTSLPPTPFAVIVEILAFESTGTPTGTPISTPTEIAPGGVPITPAFPPPPPPIAPSPRPQPIDSVVTVSCNLPCLPGNQVARYPLNDNVCLQWHENGNLQAGGQLITITLVLGAEQISQSINGYGASICRVAKIRPSGPGNYRATLIYGNISYAVSWDVE